MREWVGEAKTVDEARAAGLKKLGLAGSQVDMKILEERTSGLLSLFGFRRVKVRLVEKVRRFDPLDRADREDEDEGPTRWSDRRRSGPKGRPESKPTPVDRGASSSARDSKTEKSRKGGRSTTEGSRPSGVASKKKVQRGTPAGRPGPLAPVDKGVSSPPLPTVEPEVLLARWRPLLGWDDLTWEIQTSEKQRPVITLKTVQGKKLAGNGSRALEAFEYLFNLIASGGARDKSWISFRVEGFPSAEEARVVDKALFAAFQVRRTGQPFHFDPMPPGQRRAVHQALVHHPDVETRSEGEGPTRHVVVKPKPKNE